MQAEPWIRSEVGPSPRAGRVSMPPTPTIPPEIRGPWIALAKRLDAAFGHAEPQPAKRPRSPLARHKTR